MTICTATQVMITWRGGEGNDFLAGGEDGDILRDLSGTNKFYFDLLDEYFTAGDTSGSETFQRGATDYWLAPKAGPGPYEGYAIYLG